MTPDTTLARVTSARAALVLDQPFFGTLALQLRIVLDPTCKTAWVNGVDIGFNPAFVATLTQEQLIATWAHEVLHCALGHPWRRSGRDPQQWNKACDYAINPILQASGFTLPENVLLDPQYAGKHAEFIFDRIGQGPDPDGDEPEPGPDGQTGQDGAGDDTTQNGADQNGDGDEPSQGPPQGFGDGTTEVRDAPLPQPGDDETLTESDWQEVTAQAERLSRGSLPAGAHRQMTEQRTAAVDWRSALRRYLQAYAPTDYTWTRPNPKYAVGGLYLPSLQTESMGPLVIAVDTSGSIDPVLLAQFAGEITAICDDLKPERIDVIYCDADVCGRASFDPGEPMTLTPCGGGGTDFTPVFDTIDREQTEPVCLIYFTDLDGTFPDREPPYPVLWAYQPPSYAWRDATAPFGDILPLSD